MPVFFYIDPEISEDPRMELTSDIILSYTFFEAREGIQLPVPKYAPRKWGTFVTMFVDTVL